MLFATGTRVKFLHTGDEGVVTSILEGGMVNVYIGAEDMEIPAFPDDLVRAEAYVFHPVKAKIIKGKKETVHPQAPPVAVETQYTILKSFGIQLAFEPVAGNSGLTEKFSVLLL